MRKLIVAKYLGWKNHQTWVVNLWLSNDEQSYQHWREQAEVCYNDAANNAKNHDPTFSQTDRAAFMLADCLTEALEKLNPLIMDNRPCDLYSDLLSGALSEVNYDEIARALLEAELWRRRSA